MLVGSECPFRDEINMIFYFHEKELRVSTNHHYAVIGAHVEVQDRLKVKNYN